MEEVFRHKKIKQDGEEMTVIKEGKTIHLDAIRKGVKKENPSFTLLEEELSRKEKEEKEEQEQEEKRREKQPERKRDQKEGPDSVIQEEEEYEELELEEEVKEKKKEKGFLPPKKNRERELRRGEKRIELIRLALIHLGHTPSDDTLNEENPLYKAMDDLFDFVKKDLLTRYDWQFALTKVRLSQSPPFAHQDEGWDFTYSLPDDCLTVFAFFPKGRYEIRGNILYSHNENPILHYVKWIEDDEMPVFFEKLFTYSLTASSAVLVTNSEVIARKWEMEASQSLAAAIATDSAQSALTGASFIQNNPLFDAHFGG